MEPTKLCPECDCEYTAQAQVCADCHVPLVWRRESIEVSADAADNPWAAIPTGIVGQIAEDDQATLEDYREALADSGIPAVMLPVVRRSETGKPQLVWHSSVAGYRQILFVRREDYEEAGRIVSRAHDRRHPELVDRPYVDFPAEGCPACGSSLEGAVGECPDCGLALPE